MLTVKNSRKRHAARSSAPAISAGNVVFDVSCFHLESIRRTYSRVFLRLVADKLAKQFGDSCRLLREQDGWIAFHRRVFLQFPEICNRCFCKFVLIALFFLAWRFV